MVFICPADVVVMAKIMIALTCRQYIALSGVFYLFRYMLLEKKILALREELEEREAAMQVTTILFHVFYFH